jgi:4-hydroxy-tetrahydrodipicolinate reductase
MVRTGAVVIRVCLAGATGWVGKPLSEAIRATSDLELAATVARSGGATHRTVEEALATPSDVFVDYTSAASVKANVLAAIRAGRHVVVGSSGLSQADFDEIARAATNVGVIAVGNFAITAVLLQRFAIEAAKYIPTWEIVETASAKKIDAPSGTARELGWRLSEVRKPELRVPIENTVGDVAARGADIVGSRVHSLRVPGYMASIEIRFGLDGERLTIAHDSSSATPYVSGTLLAIRRVSELRGLVRGLDQLL